MQLGGRGVCLVCARPQVSFPTPQRHQVKQALCLCTAILPCYALMSMCVRACLCGIYCLCTQMLLLCGLLLPEQHGGQQWAWPGSEEMAPGPNGPGCGRVSQAGWVGVQPASRAAVSDARQRQQAWSHWDTLVLPCCVSVSLRERNMVGPFYKQAGILHPALKCAC